MSKTEHWNQDNRIVGCSLAVFLATVFSILPWVGASAQTKLVAPDGSTYDQFGASVAISGDTAVIGIANAAGAGAPGAAYIFVRNGASWTYQAKLTAADNGNGGVQNQFGASVAISGDTVVIGDRNAFTDDGSFLGRYGAVYVFTRGDGTWPMQARLLANQKVDNDSFASSVAISGETVFIGAPLDNFSTQDSSHGAVYVFIRNGTNWVQDAFLKASDGASNDQFGTSVGLNGDTGIIGALNKDGKGAAYIFVRSDTGWSQQAELGSSGTAGDHFGSSVAIDGNTAVVGMNPYDTPSGPQGSVAVFVRDGTTWSGQQSLAGDASADRFFGYSVAISGEQVLIGDPYDNPNSIQVPGAAYLFVRNGSKWSQQRRLTANDGAVRDVFGLSVGINSDGRPLIGAPGHDISTITNQGEAYVFDADTDGDGIPDEWEKNGITVDSAGGVSAGNTGNGVFINLPAMGADAKHKDIFVHADWMQTSPTFVNYQPDPRAIKMVIDSFATAPVDNPDGKTGINLHVDYGPDSIMNPVTEETWGTNSKAGEVPYAAVLETPAGSKSSWQAALDAVKDLRFSPAQRSAIFHYVLYCELYGEDGIANGGGVSRAIDSSDFVLAKNSRGRDPIIEACFFMHELGHNLGLRHGGGDDVNYKPNYISIMNYRFDYIGTLKGDGKQRYIDYSRRSLDTLDKANLDEIAGINDPDHHLTTWNQIPRLDSSGTNQCLEHRGSFFRLFYPTQALDWNCDGAGETAPISADINSDERCVVAGSDNTLHATPQGDDVVLGPVTINGIVLGASIVAGPNHRCDTTAGCDSTGEHCDRQFSPVGYTAPTLLTGYNDWPALRFDGGGKIGSGTNSVAAAKSARVALPAAVAQEEPPHELSIDEIVAEIPPPLIDQQQVAPFDVVTRSPQTGVAPVAVNFDGTGSTATTGTIVDWSWDFGDGSTGSGATVTHTYSTPGTYFASLTVTDSNGQVNLIPLLNRVTVADAAAVTGQLLNISTRLRALTDDNVLIGGFIVTGTLPKKVIIRGLGPSLGSSGVAGALADPTLELHQGSMTVAYNDNWKDSQQQEIIDSTIPPTNDAESAIVATLNPGAYTAVLAGKNQTTGIGLVEVYDLSQSADSKLANISTRGFVDTGDSAMIGGFIIGGASGGSGKVIVRAIGPSLPVAGALADPALELHDVNGALIASNDYWRSDQEADIIATTVPPTNDLEAAVVETLAAGPYTAIVRGVNGTTGVGLIEVYSLQ